MALIKFGAGISEMRGKEGGVIYSRNAYGAYIKAKISPVNPQTQKQLGQRSLMGNIAQAWSTLGSGDQASWDSLGAQVTRVNRFGDSTTYTGFSLFMRLNRNLSACGEDLIETAPSLPEIPVLTLGSLTANATVPTLTIGYAPTPVPTGMAMLLYVTNNILTGRRFVKNFYRLISVVPATTAEAYVLYTDWNNYFGNLLVEGAKIYLKAKLVDVATGFDGTPDTAVATVVTS